MEVIDQSQLKGTRGVAGNLTQRLSTRLAWTPDSVKMRTLTTRILKV